MVQQTIDSKFSENGLGNNETDSPTCDEQFSHAMKKTPLRDLQNHNRVPLPNSMRNFSSLKDGGSINNTIKLSGNKRALSEHSESPPHQQSPNSANGHLVYVRRKSEAEIGKSSSGDSPSSKGYSPQQKQLGQQLENAQPTSQIREQKASCLSAFAPFPTASSIIPSGKPSVPLPSGKVGTRLTSTESNQFPLPSSTPLGNLKRSKNNWEEQYHQLQLMLRKLDEADPDDYHKIIYGILLVLWSLSPVELSRHAVELEKRSIQLSLEEAKEMQRVAVLNILGKSMNDNKSPSTHQDRLQK